MKKRIEDYLHLYIGQDLQDDLENKTTKIIGSIGSIAILNWHEDAGEIYDMYDLSFLETKNKLILRPLSDMTEEEENEIDWMASTLQSYCSKALIAGEYYGMRVQDTFELTRYLLSKGFDLFGLIEAGLAIKITMIRAL